MRQIGIVKDVSPEYATVLVSRKSACEGCHANADGNCSACISLGKKELVTKADNMLGAAVGDRVLVETESGRVLTYAAAVFLLPIILSIISYILGGLAEYTFMPYVGAVVGFLVTFLASSVILNRAASKRLDVKIIEILNKSGR